jgi:hypothetical protein
MDADRFGIVLGLLLIGFGANHGTMDRGSSLSRILDPAAGCVAVHTGRAYYGATARTTNSTLDR